MMINVKPDDNVQGDFIEDTSAYLMNHEKEEIEFLEEFEYILKTIKNFIKCEAPNLPDLVKPLKL